MKKKKTLNYNNDGALHCTLKYLYFNDNAPWMQENCNQLSKHIFVDAGTLHSGSWNIALGIQEHCIGGTGTFAPQIQEHCSVDSGTLLC